MSFQLNRTLDTLVSFVVVALGLALAGATTVLGS